MFGLSWEGGPIFPPVLVLIVRDGVQSAAESVGRGTIEFVLGQVRSRLMAVVAKASRLFPLLSPLFAPREFRDQRTFWRSGPPAVSVDL